jgi:hypothetical protein
MALPRVCSIWQLTRIRALPVLQVPLLPLLLKVLVLLLQLPLSFLLQLPLLKPLTAMALLAPAGVHTQVLAVVLPLTLLLSLPLLRPGQCGCAAGWVQQADQGVRPRQARAQRVQGV